MNNPKPIIEPVPVMGGYYIAKIDGVYFPEIKAKYPNVVRRKASRWLREQEQAKILKEIQS